MIEVFVEGRSIDLDNPKMKYTKQVHDLADVSSVSTSYTNSFKAIFTPQTRQVFRLLGLIGNSSKIPYKKTSADIHSNTIQILNNGWLGVKSTNEKEADIFIQDGNIDFFKTLDNKKFGEDVFLPELNHVKDVDTVIASFTNEYYRYLINDYGGETVKQFFSILGVNIDHQAPSARIKYIWDTVFETFGFTYSGSVFTEEDFTNAWITFPRSNSAVVRSEKGLVKVESVPQTGIRGFFIIDGDWEYINGGGGVPFTTNTLIDSLVYNNIPRMQKIEIGADDNYNIKISFSGTIVRYHLVWKLLSPTFDTGAKISIYLNGNKINQIISDDDDLDFNMALVAGDVLSFRIHALTKEELQIDPKYNIVGVEDSEWGDFEFKLATIESEDTNFESEFKNISPKDFIKEVLWRFGLTPIPQGTNVHFMKWDEFLDDYIDWTGKYSRRLTESYTLGNYSQQNRLQHLYNEEKQDYADGLILVDNENLNEETILLTSKFYAPLNVIKKYDTGANQLAFKPTPIWEKEVTQEENGDIGIKYKGLSGRYYWLKSETVENVLFLASDNLTQTGTAYSFTKANTFDTTFFDLVPKNYIGFNKMLDDVKVLNIELDLTELDVLNLDFTKVYYFEQESGFFRLNKLEFQEGAKAKGEFIRVKR